jgi:hypothetical protein
MRLCATARQGSDSAGGGEGVRRRTLPGATWEVPCGGAHNTSDRKCVLRQVCPKLAAIARLDARRHQHRGGNRVDGRNPGPWAHAHISPPAGRYGSDHPHTPDPRARRGPDRLPEAVCTGPERQRRSSSSSRRDTRGRALARHWEIARERHRQSVEPVQGVRRGPLRLAASASAVTTGFGRVPVNAASDGRRQGVCPPLAVALNFTGH